MSKATKLKYRDFIDILFSDKITQETIDEHKSQIKQFMKYAWDMFLNLPRAVRYLNRYVNDYEYLAQPLHEQVLFLQDFIKRANIGRHEIRTVIPSFEKRSQLKDDLGKSFGTNDANTLYSLAKLGILSGNNLVAKPDQARPEKLTKEEKELVKKAIEQHYNNNAKPQHGDMILKELTQEIIDELDLSLFDISILDKRNQILYVFIDKDNKKRLYIEPFEYQFEIHSAASILDKDYFVPKNEVYPYIITNARDYMKLRGAINENFRNAYEIPMVH